MRKKYTTPVVCLYGTLDDFINGTPTDTFAVDFYSNTCGGTIVNIDCETGYAPPECQYFAGKGLLNDQQYAIPCP